jgi:acetylornithine/succinyldiaminopimelate/putrescine aminotransferase
MTKNIAHGNMADIEQITEQTAAVIIEIIGGEAGVRVPTVEYFQALRKKCDEVGALLIIDEIQTGFGRTGSFGRLSNLVFIPM